MYTLKANSSKHKCTKSFCFKNVQSLHKVKGTRTNTAFLNIWVFQKNCSTCSINVRSNLQHPEMSGSCRDQLRRRQSMMSQDYRVSHGLSRACKIEITENKCRSGVEKERDSTNYNSVK
jgi:hypothetical protein